MTPIVPIFRSHYSLGPGGSSLLTLEEPGKAKPGNPLSVFDCAKSAGLTHVHLIDNRIDGALQAYKSAAKAGVSLCYGVKLRIVADVSDKTPDSKRGESSIIVLATGGKAGYQDLIRIWNRAWGYAGQFIFRDDRYGRTDWDMIGNLWTENLGLALPYFSSFIAKNTLTFSQITPSFPRGVVPWLLKETDGGGLPFAPLLDTALDRYIGEDAERRARLVPSKTVLYSKRSDFKAYTVLRALHEGGTFATPNVNHFHSNSFSFEDYAALAAPLAPS